MVAWSPEHEHSCSVTELADRLLVRPAEIRAAIDCAAEKGWLEVVVDGEQVTMVIPGGDKLPELDLPPLGPV